MNIFEKIIYFFDFQLKKAPVSYGLWHIFFVIIMIGLAFYLIKYKRQADENYLKKVLKITWFTMVGLEIMKQILFSFSFNSKTLEVSWAYHWYAFPFQFCSSPIYILPFAIYSKKEKVREKALAFLALYSFFAGVLVMAYPTSVFTKSLLVNMQTMVHHGLQMAIGAYIIAYQLEKIDYKYVLKALKPYLWLVLAALVMDELALYVCPGSTFNMFFISRHFDCSLPILSSIQPHVPYLVFLFIYIAGFTAGAFIVNLCVLLIKHIIKVKKYNKNNVKVATIK